MRNCPKCHIQVGGNLEICPICQNGLEGEGSGQYYWPPLLQLKKQSMFYKIQLMIVLAIVAVAIGLDFLMDLYKNLHWSVIVAIWGISIEYMINRTIKRNFVLAKVLGGIILSIVVLILVTAWYANFWNLAVMYIIPIIVIVALITNSILSLIDKRENAMVYLLCSVLGGSLPVVAMLIIDRKAPVLWSICVILSVVSIIGMAIFKGGKLLQEIRKRTSL